MKRLLFGLGALALAAVSNALGFGDVRNWTGTGTNQAAMVIDWNDGRADESVVWGFRWNGTASGEDMLRAIVAANDDLYVKVSDTTPYGVALFGVGRDLNGGGLALTSGEPFVNRTIVADYGTADGASPVDAADRYREGWYSGYWSYWLGEGDGTLPTADEWGYSGTGMTGRVLQNGSWDGWSYDDFGGGDTTPGIPVAAAAAVPEPASLVVLGVGLVAALRRRRR